MTNYHEEKYFNCRFLGLVTKWNSQVFRLERGKKRMEIGICSCNTVFPRFFSGTVWSIWSQFFWGCLGVSNPNYKQLARLYFACFSKYSSSASDLIPPGTSMFSLCLSCLESNYHPINLVSTNESHDHKLRISGEIALRGLSPTIRFLIFGWFCYSLVVLSNIKSTRLEIILLKSFHFGRCAAESIPTKFH